MIYFVHPRKILNEALYLIGSGTYMFYKVFYRSVDEQSSSFRVKAESERFRWDSGYPKMFVRHKKARDGARAFLAEEKPIAELDTTVSALRIRR